VILKGAFYEVFLTRNSSTELGSSTAKLVFLKRINRKKKYYWESKSFSISEKGGLR